MGAARRLSGRERVRRHFRDAETVGLVACVTEGLGAAWQGETSNGWMGLVIQNKKEVSKMSKRVCVICGAEWEDGKGFTQEHIFPCANQEHGWAFTIEVSDDWLRVEIPEEK